MQSLISAEFVLLMSPTDGFHIVYVPFLYRAIEKKNKRNKEFNRIIIWKLSSER